MEYKWNARAISTKGTIGNGTAQFLFPFIGITVTRSSLQNIVAGTLLGVIPHRAPNVDHAYQTSHRIAKRVSVVAQRPRKVINGGRRRDRKTKRGGSEKEMRKRCQLTRLFVGSLFSERESAANGFSSYTHNLR